jgi:hypothetical protein
MADVLSAANSTAGFSLETTYGMRVLSWPFWALSCVGHALYVVLVFLVLFLLFKGISFLQIRTIRALHGEELVEEEGTASTGLACFTTVSAMVWSIYYGGGDPIPHQSWYLTIIRLQGEVYVAAGMVELAVSVPYITLRVLYMAFERFVGYGKGVNPPAKVVSASEVDVEMNEQYDETSNKEAENIDASMA